MTAGKGDRYRPIDREKWNEGWKRVFKGEPIPIELEDELVERRKDLLRRVDKEPKGKQ